MIARGVHFLDDPADTIAQKALRVNLSDLAGKGATPLGYVLSLGAPARISMRTGSRLCRWPAQRPDGASA